MAYLWVSRTSQHPVAVASCDWLDHYHHSYVWSNHCPGSVLQSSSDYPAPDIPAIPIQWHFFEMIRSEKKKVQVPSVQ